MPLTKEELLKENKSLKRKVKLLEQSVTQVASIKSSYDILIEKLKDRDKRLEEMNNRLEVLVKQRTSELEDKNEQLKSLTITDTLTNINNRRAFDDIFPREFNRAKRQGYEFNILLIDVDNFKKYNDFYGHYMGDKVLEQMGDLLNKFARRADDFAFRYGGEEFVYLTSLHKEDELLKFAQKIKNTLIEKKINHEKNDCSKYVTISVGGVTSMNENISLEKVFALADKNLYKAKSEGRNRVCISSL